MPRYTSPLTLLLITTFLVTAFTLYSRRSPSSPEYLSERSTSSGHAAVGYTSNNQRLSSPYSSSSTPKNPSKPKPKRSHKPNTYGHLLLSLSPSSLSRLSTHPITTLIEEGKKKAEEIERRIRGVKSLEDAVRDYEEAWGMKPPRGFELWYKFATTHSSLPTPSLYSSTHTSILPYLAYPGSLLRERLREIEDVDATFFFEFTGYGGDGKGKKWAQRGGYLKDFYRTE